MHRSVAIVVLILINTALLRNVRTVNRTILVSNRQTDTVEASMLMQHLLDGAQNVKQVVGEQLSDAHDSLRKHVQDAYVAAVEAIASDTNNMPETVTSYLTGAATGTESSNNKDSEPQKPHKPLNILILYPDDMRHDSLGIAGTQVVQTPFLDSLARKGMRFTHNCVTTSICWISRANLFTGQYVSRHKARLLRTPLKPEQWNNTWPAILKRNGYFTGHIGKWQYW